MENNKKIKYFGYADMCNSLVEIGMATIANGLSMYFILEKETYAGFFATYLLPVLNLIATMVLIGINVRQMKAAKKLVRLGKEIVSKPEMEETRDNWKCRNIVTCLAACIWYVYLGIIMFWLQGWYVSVILALFFAETVSRGVVMWKIYAFNFVELTDGPSLPPDLMEEYMHMIRIRHQQEEIAMGEPVGSKGVQTDNV